MKDTIYREDAIKALRLEYPSMPMFKSLREEWAIKTEGFRKAEEVIMNVPSADVPNAMEIMNAYHEGVRKGIAEAYEAYGLQGWLTVIRDTFCSDCKGYRHDNCEYRESCYTMRVLDEVERRQHE